MFVQAVGVESKEKNVGMQIEDTNCTDDLMYKEIVLLLRYGVGEVYEYTALSIILLYTKLLHYFRRKTASVDTVLVLYHNSQNTVATIYT